MCAGKNVFEFARGEIYSAFADETSSLWNIYHINLVVPAIILNVKNKSKN